MFVKFKLIFFYINVPEFSFDCYNSNIIIGRNCLFIKSCMHFELINILFLNQPFSFLQTFFISWLIGSDYDQGFILAFFLVNQFFNQKYSVVKVSSSASFIRAPHLDKENLYEICIMKSVF